MFTVWFFAINWISDENIPALCVPEKLFVSTPRGASEKSFLFILFLLSCVGSFILKISTRSGGKRSGEYFARLLCCWRFAFFRAAGLLFSSCTCWTRRFYDVVGGVGCKCLFVVLLYTVQQWEAYRIFAAIKVTSSSVRSWSEVNFSVRMLQRVFLSYRPKI